MSCQPNKGKKKEKLVSTLSTGINMWLGQGDTERLRDESRYKRFQNKGV